MTILQSFKQKFNAETGSGNFLAIAGILFLFVLILLINSMINFSTLNPVTLDRDMTANAILYASRNAVNIKIFFWVTQLGESQIITLLALTTTAILWYTRKKWEIIPLWLSIIGSEGTTFVAKIIFHRPRPVNAVFLESQNSFPSGHATIAVAFYGMIAYFLFKKTKNIILRSLIILSTFIVMTAIGFSRLYLGVHYVSDVWTGYLIGTLWLLIGITTSELEIFKNKKLANKIKL